MNHWKKAKRHEDSENEKINRTKDRHHRTPLESGGGQKEFYLDAKPHNKASYKICLVDVKQTQTD